MAYRLRIFFTDKQKSEIWDRWQRGESMSSIGRLFERKGRDRPLRSSDWRLLCSCYRIHMPCTLVCQYGWGECRSPNFQAHRYVRNPLGT